MVQGVGGTGNSGALTDSFIYNSYKRDWEQYRKEHPESSLSLENYLQMKGYIGYFNQQMENFVEGNVYDGDGNDGNSVNANKRIQSQGSTIYQGEDEDTYYEFDYDSGVYRKIEGNEAIKKALGLAGNQNADTIVFGQNSVAITDYTFGNLDDGQDSSSYRVNGKYSNVIYTNQEFDIHYILNALLMDPTDPQYKIAKGIFDDLCAHTSQWLPESEMEELDAVAAEYGTNSVEYKAKLQEILLKNLDQAQEWVEEHSHVKNTSTGSLEDLGSSDGTNGTDGTDGTESTTGTVPDYNKDTVINNAGMTADYNTGFWKGCNHYDDDTQKISATNDAMNQANTYLSNIISSLSASLGENCTQEMTDYMNKAKNTVMNNQSFVYIHRDGHGWCDDSWNGEVKTKELVDAFFNEFNTLCVNKGKTTAEVEAERKAAEEKAAREKQAYQGIYNTNFVSLANEAGVNKDIQVVNVTQAAEIQAKAESEILNPLKNKIIAQYAGTIPSSDLQTMLDNAANAALADCTEWANTSNNYVYTIDADKLISRFQENVQTVINNKGVLA